MIFAALSLITAAKESVENSAEKKRPLSRLR